MTIALIKYSLRLTLRLVDQLKISYYYLKLALGDPILLKPSLGNAVLIKWNNQIEKLFQNNYSIFPDDWHLSKKKSFYLARLALLECLDDYGQTFTIDQLAIKHFQEFNGFRLSLSHTDNWACALVAPTNECLGLGIDIELTSRKISPKTQNFVANTLDSQEFTAIEKWCLKEAIYKSIPYQSQKGIALKDLPANTKSSFQNFHFENEVFSIDELTIACSYLKYCSASF